MSWMRTKNSTTRQSCAPSPLPTTTAMSVRNSCRRTIRLPLLSRPIRSATCRCQNEWGIGRSLLLRSELSSVLRLSDVAPTRNKAVKHERKKAEEAALMEDDTVMNKLNHLRIRGFRRLYDVDLDLRPMMVMIRAHGVGKTSILYAVSLL